VHSRRFIEMVGGGIHIIVDDLCCLVDTKNQVALIVRPDAVEVKHEAAR